MRCLHRPHQRRGLQLLHLSGCLGQRQKDPHPGKPDGPGGELSDIQQAFIDEAAIQCGFCTPGFIMSSVEILESGKEYTDAELRKLLSGHLCRCTGYENIIKAVKKTMYKRLGKPMPEEA